MTSTAQKQAGYLLPDKLTPHDLICVEMKIPNERLYRAAFVGALTELGRWWNWQKTYEGGDTRASDAAQYWRTLIDEHLQIGRCKTGIIQTEYVYPPWLTGSPGCWIIDMGDLDGELNIIQRVEFCETQQDEFCPPDEWKVQPASGGSDGVNAVDINNLQQQIDTLQNQVSDLQTDLAETDAAALEQRIQQIGSVRWYPTNANIPDGWRGFAGQEFLAVGTEGFALWQRTPDAWHSGGGVITLPPLNFVPGAIGNAFAGDYGDISDVFTDASGNNSDRIRWINGRWYIYVGNAPEA